MKYDSVLALKREVFDELDLEFESGEEHQAARNASAQSVRIMRPKQRIAVGYSAVGRGDYRLEIRVQRDDGPGYQRAQRLVERAKGEARIQVTSQTAVPPKSRLEAVPSQLAPIDCADRPLHIGLSVGHRENPAGTLGAFVRLSADDRIAILSNCHVLANLGKAQIGDPVYHPGREPGARSMDARHHVAQVSNFVELSVNYDNHIDAAVAELLEGCSAVGTRIPAGYNYPDEGKPLLKLEDYSAVHVRETRVAKIGRTSGYTRGVIGTVALDYVDISYPGIGSVVFSDVIEVWSLEKNAPFTQPGDSGSLVFLEDSLEACGLHFAGGVFVDSGIHFSYICRLDTVLEWADAELWNG